MIPIRSRSSMAFSLLLCAICPLALFGAEPNDWLGKKVPQLVLADGKTYSDVTFTKLEADAVTISHAGGIARVPMESLQPAAQEALGYDPEKAAAARKKFLEAKAAAEMANAQRVMAEQTKEAAQRKVEELAAAAVPMTCEVWEVKENGFLAYDIRWLDDKERRIHGEESRQFISLGDSDDFEIYEGKIVNLHATAVGTIDIDGSRLKHWVFVPTALIPDTWEGNYPSDFR